MAVVKTHELGRVTLLPDRPRDVAGNHADLVAKAESLMKLDRRDDPNWPFFTSQKQRNEWRRNREAP